MATLPRRQQVADAESERGVRSLGLPPEYPSDADGKTVGHEVCQEIGVRVRQARLRGVWCRSAATPDGSGRELAYFPATVRSRARPALPQSLAFGRWRDARTWPDLGLEDQRDL